MYRTARRSAFMSNWIFSKLTGRNANPWWKQVTKRGNVRITDTVCNHFHWLICRFEQMLRSIDAHEDDIFVRGIAALLLKQAGKVKLTHIDVPCQLGKRQRLSVMLADILNGSLGGSLCIAGVCVRLGGITGNKCNPDRIEPQRQLCLWNKLIVAPSI